MKNKKDIAIYVTNMLLAVYLVMGCSVNSDVPVNEEQSHLFEVALNYQIEGYVQTKANYLTDIQAMDIMAFDVNTGILKKHIFIPGGANPPTSLRLPWGKYYIVFAGNFFNLSVIEDLTTINDILVTMNSDPNYLSQNDVFIAPTTPFYYYITGIVQFGIVASIPVVLRPITTQVISNFTNKPNYYTTLKIDIRNIGKSLSMRGTSLAPAVRVIKDITGLTPAMTTVKDTTYTFASIGGSSYIRLCATDIYNEVDSVDFYFTNSFMSGSAYIVNFTFPPSPELNMLLSSGKRLRDLNIKCEIIDNTELR